mgnify:CR=1 FL=1
MTNAHHAALFNYSEYIKEVHQLDLQLHPDEYGKFHEQIKQSIRSLKEKWPSIIDENYLNRDGVAKEVQSWPLYHHGDGPLIREDEVNRSTPPPSEIAYYYRILLAKYLQPCPRSPLGNWSVLNSALVSLGWTRKERELLFLGIPTYKLLKPNIEEEQSWPISEHSPYWLMVHPFGSRSGWLTTEKIRNNLSKLKKIKDNIGNFDIHKIANIKVDNPVVIQSYRNYLDSAFEDTIAMYLDAIDSDKGLFMSITLLGVDI